MDLLLRYIFGDKKETRHDLFTSLLDANDVEEEGYVKLQDNELIGQSCFERICAVAYTVPLRKYIHFLISW